MARRIDCLGIQVYPAGHVFLLPLPVPIELFKDSKVPFSFVFAAASLNVQTFESGKTLKAATAPKCSKILSQP